MKSKARKNGNSLVVTIPPYFKDKLGIENGSILDLDMQGKKIIIKKENDE